MSGYVQNIAGNAAQLIPGSLRIEYGPKGCTSHFSLICPTIGPLVQYLNYVQARGGSGEIMGCDVGIDGQTGAVEKSMTVSIPGLVNNLNQFIQELYFDQWELLSDHGTDSIFSNPLITGSAGWMDANDKDVLSEVATKQLSLSAAVTQADTDVSANAPHSLPTDPRSLQIMTELLKGQSEYQSPNYVLRHTSYCSANSLYNTSVANTQLIYSPAQLLTEVGTNWTYNCPPRLISVISSIPYQFAPADEASYYSWGWLKSITRQPVLSNFIVETNTEYACGLWSNLRYAHR